MINECEEKLNGEGKMKKTKLRVTNCLPEGNAE